MDGLGHIKLRKGGLWWCDTKPNTPSSSSPPPPLGPSGPTQPGQAAHPEISVGEKNDNLLFVFPVSLLLMAPARVTMEFVSCQQAEERQTQSPFLFLVPVREPETHRVIMVIIYSANYEPIVPLRPLGLPECHRLVVVICQRVTLLNTVLWGGTGPTGRSQEDISGWGWSLTLCTREAEAFPREAPCHSIL